MCVAQRCFLLNISLKSLSPTGFLTILYFVLGAYPQDAIPGWTQQQASDTFPSSPPLELGKFYMGDNVKLEPS
jgi:hypothetical protein